MRNRSAVEQSIKEEQMPKQPAILIIVTSHDRIDADHPTGLWLEEFALPYELFCEQGCQSTIASPKGGAAPIDPNSLADGASERYPTAIAMLADTQPLGSLDPDHFDAVFFPGGHGTMFDLPHNGSVSRIVEAMARTGKMVAAVCHGPAGLIGATAGNGLPLVEGCKLTAFTNAEERAVELDGKMPFLLETRLQELGALFIEAPMWRDHTIRDGWLITGQNPQSSGSVAQALLDALEKC
jgi:putative intracellular protease/amidase